MEPYAMPRYGDVGNQWLSCILTLGETTSKSQKGKEPRVPYQKSACVGAGVFAVVVHITTSHITVSSRDLV